MKVEVRSYKTTPFNFYESNLYHGEILVASGPTGAEILSLAARAPNLGILVRFGPRDPFCNRNWPNFKWFPHKYKENTTLALALYYNIGKTVWKNKLPIKSYVPNRFECFGWNLENLSVQKILLFLIFFLKIGHRAQPSIRKQILRSFLDSTPQKPPQHKFSADFEKN